MTFRLRRSAHLLVAAAFGLGIAVPASAQDAATIARLRAAAGAYTTCLTATVQMGMTVKMDPDRFKDGFAKSCLQEEGVFRAEAIRAFVAQGKSEVDAAVEVDGNIANGRRIYAADQESYIRTGRVPH